MLQTRGGFLKNNASLSGLGHWFRNLGSLKKNIKTSVLYYIYMRRIKKSFKSKFGAEFVATITDFGEAARQTDF